MLRHLTLLSLLVACGPDETLTGYARPDATYVLDLLDGAAFPARATLRLDTPGQVRGDAPCNSYTAPQTVPYPWFEAGAFLTTRKACLDLAAETAFFAALSEMEFAEALGGTLILSNSVGREMVFQVE